MTGPPQDSPPGPAVGGSLSPPEVDALPGGSVDEPTGQAPGAAGAGSGGAENEPQAGEESDALSASALDDLRAYLLKPPEERSPIQAEPFSVVPLNAADSQTARDLLWKDRSGTLAEERLQEHTEKRITIGEHILRYETAVLGEPKAPSRSLFISMHGGGGTAAATNDDQWRNQIDLGESYGPQDALWVAPRAPNDVWNMWFESHIDDLFDRLITNMLVFEGIDPDRVYLTGYSAGGDGVYQLGPRMADRWAGAAMSAGHPNDATPHNLRNLAFAIHVGGADSAYMRNEVAETWGAELQALAATDEGAYKNQVQVHAGLPHWMNLADKVSIPFIQEHKRSTAPSRVVWRQSPRLHQRSYWLKAGSPPTAAQRVQASVDGQTITIEEAVALSKLELLLSDELLDLDEDISVESAGTELFCGTLPRTILNLAATLEDREDPQLMYPAMLAVTL